MKLHYLATAIISATLLTACGGGGGSNNSGAAASNINIENTRKVLKTNADIALAAYSDAVDTAVKLETALTTLRNNPTQANLNAARKAWLVAREPYGQTEVFRFRKSPIDSTDYSSEDGPEGAINAWPLGEALIDYVVIGGDFTSDQIGVSSNAAGVNGGGAVNATNASGNNIIATTSITIDTALLEGSVSADVDERDVIAGYHAIEFLLWGQDLNNSAAVTNGDDRETAVKTVGASNLATGGQRPITDFQPGFNGTTVLYDSTNLANRRHQYLQVAVAKLIADLKGVRDGWKVGADYRTAFTTINTEAEAKQKLFEILVGMGTLSEGELAGERMQIAFSVNSQEDEHSCFSDNTHRDIWLDAEGISNSYYGAYAGYDSNQDGVDDVTTRAVDGYGLNDYLADANMTTLKTTLETKLTATQAGYEAIDAEARAGKPVDVLIMAANKTATNPLSTTILALSDQAKTIADVAAALNIDGDVVDDDASNCDTSNPDANCD